MRSSRVSGAERAVRSTLARALDLCLLAGAVGLLVATAVGVLTLRLNPQVHELARDSALLLFYFALGGAAAGTIAGVASALLFVVASRFGKRVAATTEGVLVSLLFLGPLVWLALLPDVGLAPQALGWAIFSQRTGPIVVAVVAGAVVLSVIGLGLQLLHRRLVGERPSRTAAALAGIAALALAAVALLDRPTPVEPPVLSELPPAPTRPPDPVVLLCIDGLDPEVMAPLLAAGELPTFARLIERGVHGELATYAPTLSPAIWTTMVTGKSPGEHGIAGFAVFALPGLERSVASFPLHTGLNFRLPPLLERLPGLEHLRRPYTSDMRRVPALWTIAARYWPTGVYRWRVSWPAETIDGFVLASSVTLGESAADFGGRDVGSLEAMPPTVTRGWPAPPPVDEDELRRYWRPETEIANDDGRAARLRLALQTADAARIAFLFERHRPRLLVAAFPDVDSFHHLFGTDRRDGGPFAPAIDERYRWVDARLGELLERLPAGVNVVVVSDHGYDFEANHHALAPPGVIVAAGPAFPAGRRIEGLTVFDVAPLVLRLLDLPVAADMPAVGDGDYRRALAAELADSRPERTIESWGSRADATWVPVRTPDRERILDELEALGYIE